MIIKKQQLVFGSILIWHSFILMEEKHFPPPPFSTRAVPGRASEGLFKVKLSSPCIVLCWVRLVYVRIYVSNWPLIWGFICP